MKITVALMGALALACGSAYAQTYPFPNAPYAGDRGTGAPSTSDQILIQQGVNTHDPVGSSARMTLGTLQGLIGGLPLSGGTLTGPFTAGTFVSDARTSGAKCDGTTDDTTAINAAIASVSGQGGGTVFLPSGTCVMLGAMVIPYTGTNNPVQNPIRITGSTGNFDSYLGNSVHGVSTPIGGAVLDMRYGGGDGTHVAKIDTRGAGTLEIDHLTIEDTASDNYQFIQTTNTTLLIHDNRFVGNPACSGTTCTQNVIALGGLTSASSVLATNVATDGFQGYGTKIENNDFSHIQEGVSFGGSANAVYLANNTFDVTCGSAAAQGAPYHFYGVGLGSGGNEIIGGIVEMKNYPYAVSMTTNGSNNEFNFISGLGVYDQVVGGTAQAIAYFDATSIFNSLYVGFASGNFATTDGAGAVQNMVLSAQAGGRTQFPYNVGFGHNAGQESVTFNGGGTANNDGAVIRFYNNSILKSAIGNYSAVLGGAYNQIMVIWDGGRGITMPSDSLGVGTGTIGARLDVLGTGTGAELAFRVQSSTPGNLFSVADNGTVTVGTTPGVSCTAGTVSLSTLVVTNGIVTHC